MKRFICVLIAAAFALAPLAAEAATGGAARHAHKSHAKAARQATRHHAKRTRHVRQPHHAGRSGAHKTTRAPGGSHTEKHAT